MIKVSGSITFKRNIPDSVWEEIDREIFDEPIEIESMAELSAKPKEAVMVAKKKVAKKPAKKAVKKKAVAKKPAKKAAKKVSKKVVAPATASELH